MEKAKEIEIAKKRRAKLLEEFKRLGWTKSKFAAKHKLTNARMWQLLKMAEEEHAISHKKLA